MYRHRPGRGSRARRAGSDQERFEQTITAILCDVIHAELAEPGSWRYATFSREILGRAGRGPDFITETFPVIVRCMSEPATHTKARLTAGLLFLVGEQEAAYLRHIWIAQRCSRSAEGRARGRSERFHPPIKPGPASPWVFLFPINSPSPTFTAPQHPTPDS